MGLFKNIFGGKKSSQPSFSMDEAFIAIALAIVAADGHFSAKEKEAMATNMYRMNVFKGISDSQINYAIDKATLTVERHGVKALIEAAKEALLPEMRETAFFFACDLALADGYLDKEEENLIEQLQTGLAINKKTAIKIIEVVIIKNRS